MKVISKEEFALHKEEFLNRIMEGAVFIYPTDTIYGIGCNALNADAVRKIREIKERPNAPFSIIAPSRQWIEENCEVDEEASDWFEKLPGPYTFIMNMKNMHSIAEGVIQKDTVGIRIPAHWISKVAALLDIPIITTSVNKRGKEFMTKLDNLDQTIKSRVDFIIDEGEKKGRPSHIIHLETEEVIVQIR